MKEPVGLNRATELMIKDTVLEKIVTAKLNRINERMKALSLGELKEKSLLAPVPCPSLISAVARQGELNIIGEIKKASPSKGVIQPDFDPVAQAIAYVQGGVNAISVLTEEDFFLGHDSFLVSVKAHVNKPLLRKDFVIHESQIYESRLLGASAILLIAAMLDDDALKFFMGEARSIGLEVLLEVHDEEELKRAVDLGAAMIGINNRDLKTFVVDIGTTERLAPLIPAGTVIIAESGIHTRADMVRAHRAGASGVLIGESLMRAAGSERSVGEKIRELLGE